MVNNDSLFNSLKQPIKAISSALYGKKRDRNLRPKTAILIKINDV